MLCRRITLDLRVICVRAVIRWKDAKVSLESAAGMRQEMTTRGGVGKTWRIQSWNAFLYRHETAASYWTLQGALFLVGGVFSSRRRCFTSVASSLVSDVVALQRLPLLSAASFLVSGTVSHRRLRRLVIAPGLRVSAGTACQRWDCVSLSELSSVAVDAFSLRAGFFKKFVSSSIGLIQNITVLKLIFGFLSFGITNMFRSSEKIA